MSPVKRRNRISGQWSMRPIEMLESPAWRVLSLSARMVIDRIAIELAHHGGNDNGQLPVTTDDFVRYGMHRTSVAPAIREAEALGFIRVTERGRGGNAEYRAPNKFYQTFATWRGGVPTDEWRRIKTLEEAEQIACAARAAKDQRAVAHGRRSWRKRRQEQKTGTENSHVSMPENRTETAESPVRKTQPTGSGEETVRLSISRVGEAQPHLIQAELSDTESMIEAFECVADEHVPARPKNEMPSVDDGSPTTTDLADDDLAAESEVIL